VVGIAIGITGSILVFDHEIDARLNPQRYALSGPKASLPPAQYIESAAKVLEGGARPVILRLPEEAGLPVMVFARARGESAGMFRVYLDPPTAQVLDTAPGGGFIGTVHNFHENLMAREYMGREFVGMVGFALLISSLSGIYLWWPGRGRLRQALGIRPGLATSRNLHYLCGFYGSLVLALLSFTGICLAYPDAGRALVGAITPVSPSIRGLQTAEPRAGKPIPLEQALGVAQALYPAAKISGVGLPNGPRGAYRVNLRDPAVSSAQPGSNIIVFLDPATGAVLRRSDPVLRTGGDNFIALQRTLHTGEQFGIVGRIVVCVAGLLPGLLATTGTLMWLRQRRQRRAAGALQLAGNHPAQGRSARRAFD
jgi:uncharacterized iron-regulated membrane protein